MKASLFLASALAATGLAAPSTSPQVAKRGKGTVTDIRGVVSVDPVKKVITVSFRGSSSVRNWIANVVFVQSSCSDLVSGCLVHTGFYTAWKEVATKVTAAVKSAKATYPSYSIGVTGHSLGGAVATVAAAYLRKAGYTADLYTFGSPRVGNKAFAAFTTSQSGEEYRVTHDKDPVPRLPPIVFNYRHTSPEWWLKVPSPTASQVKICTGYASISCNAGTLGLEVDDHLDYFGGIADCSAGGFNWKRDDFNVAASNVSDEELEARLNTWVAEDVDYVNSNNLETEA
ncbi:unnamed protein product [Sordaria macrospora k-hell]|uniref:WGS project CABT00000000 data, contig 2.7 n=1 Tax=Sordaria macrospora (strain ATCC MYA-333 / DSM 997 / K(L3346) / K-hell) TaxID=771870 RepID=F7VU97_SORMK|nr:uncharacterized protein SMAC_03086 [Sordaria macrospora k-hell]CCC09085.1 unnamed protein product [Sordaria macrospora k-hell]